MNLSGLDQAFWAASFLSNAVLFAVLIVWRRWKIFPAFTALICFYFADSILLYAIFLNCSSRWYVRLYYASEVPGFALQLGVIWEIARTVLRPTRSWVRDAKKQFLLWGTAGILLAAALPWLVRVPETDVFAVLEIRSDVFASVLMSELVTVLLLTSNRLGLGWRNHVMALGNGWGATAVVGIVVDGLHSYFGIHHYYRALERSQMFAYVVIDLYWIYQFWREEPPRRPISPELKAYIEDLHRRVTNNLDTLGAQR